MVSIRTFSLDPQLVLETVPLFETWQHQGQLSLSSLRGR